MAIITKPPYDRLDYREYVLTSYVTGSDTYRWWKDAYEYAYKEEKKIKKDPVKHKPII